MRLGLRPSGSMGRGSGVQGTVVELRRSVASRENERGSSGRERREERSGGLYRERRGEGEPRRETVGRQWPLTPLRGGENVGERRGRGGFRLRRGADVEGAGSAGRGSGRGRRAWGGRARPGEQEGRE